MKTFTLTFTEAELDTISSALDDYVDSLNKDGLVTDYQAYNWSNPF